MTYHIAPDLQAARQKGSLTKGDCAHLLGVDFSRITRIESGERAPKLVEVALLCFIFNMEMREIQKKIVLGEAQKLGARLTSISKEDERKPKRRERLNTLNGASARLLALKRGP
jgi:transcriptional regulator with XRE-family HTH domain